jgi:hypothetical protein
MSISLGRMKCLYLNGILYKYDEMYVNAVSQAQCGNDELCSNGIKILVFRNKGEWLVLI